MCVQLDQQLPARGGRGAGASLAAEGGPQGTPISITLMCVMWRKSQSMTMPGAMWCEDWEDRPPLATRGLSFILAVICKRKKRWE